MTASVVTSPYGAAAHDALADAVAALKDGNPLRPVSVVVSSNQIGVAARRALGRRGGVAAVTFLTPYRLAELLGAADVAAAGKRPVSTPVIAGAVRAVLESDPGHFGPVASHPTTQQSLVRAHRALSEVGPKGLERLRSATASQAAEVVRVHEAVNERLSDRFSNERDLVRAAVDVIERGSTTLSEMGPTIVFLPQNVTSNQGFLLRTLAEHHETRIIAGVTGVPEADQAIRRSVEVLGASWPGGNEPTPTPADRAISVSDADEEVRHVVRGIVDAARRGTPLARIAVLYGTRDPYARLLADALSAAEIEWSGSAVRTADQSLLGRSLLALLALGDRDFSRADVCAWMAGAPVRGVDNRLVPVAAWERLSRSAGVVAGPEQWTQRLTRHIDDLQSDLTQVRPDEEREWKAQRLTRDIELAQQLVDFVAAVHTSLQPGRQGATWRGLARWCHSLIRTYLGGDGLRGDWPAEERNAASRIEAAIDRLGDLDGIDPAPSPSAFRQALTLQLADDLGRHGSLGSGVVIGPVGLGVGLELDEVFLVGMAEGSFPARRRDDPLLPDRVRQMVGPDLAQRADRVNEEHHALLAVLSAAGRATMTFPRGDLRRSSERAPSRWLLDSTEAHDGVRPSPEELNTLTGDWFQEVPSFIAGLKTTDFPASRQDYDTRALLDHHERGQQLATSEVLAERAEVRSGIELLQGRLSKEFTRFDGNLASDGDLRGITLPDPSQPGQVTSASRLEKWASCPYAYFVRYILGVSEIEDPEEEYRISALTKGSWVHDVLDRWVSDAAANGSVPDSGTAWTADQIADLQALSDAEARRLEARGQVGRAVYWNRDQLLVWRDLEKFVSFDTKQRAAFSSTPLASELSFGLPNSDHPEVSLTLPDGRTLALRGAIDRVDSTADGSLVVIDYKTGSARNFTKISAENPTPAGKHLQLVLYTLVARSLTGRHGPHDHASYWLITQKGGFKRFGYPVTSEVEVAALETVSRIIDGIAAGHFPAKPQEPGYQPFVECACCQPDGLGTAHQYRDWRRLIGHPELADFHDLVEAT